MTSTSLYRIFSYPISAWQGSMYIFAEFEYYLAIPILYHRDLCPVPYCIAVCLSLVLYLDWGPAHCHLSFINLHVAHVSWPYPYGEFPLRNMLQASKYAWFLYQTFYIQSLIVWLKEVFYYGFILVINIFKQVVLLLFPFNIQAGEKCECHYCGKGAFFSSP